MKDKDLHRLGLPKGPLLEMARAVAEKARADGMRKKDVIKWLSGVARRPGEYVEDDLFGEFARAVRDEGVHLSGEEKALPERSRRPEPFTERSQPAPWMQWGSRDIDPNAIEQLENACRLPISVRGALMPDAHLGYGLPIGGVLAVTNAVIPYAVGVDIACRMRMTVIDLPPKAIKGEEKRLRNAIEAETRFGVGAEFKGNERRDHPVMDEDWTFSPILEKQKRKASGQLGTSGSGNHFVEFGTLEVRDPRVGLAAGAYTALLSHSGSRGVGNAVATHYSRAAMQRRPDMPRDLRHLAWLELDTDLGREYWFAMELMGRYAAANHELIHRHIVRNLRAKVLLEIENHHNFAWKETHGGRDVIVHRKGATPASLGAIGIIPGSMATPGYVVAGKGNPQSLDSAAHGAGRHMSRSAAKRSITWSQVKKILQERDVQVISADLDEAPLVYKDIESVMEAQSDLVDILARFDPKLVKMSPPGERAED